MGVGCDASQGGEVHVTDMDSIARSNLNRPPAPLHLSCLRPRMLILYLGRQFLFRPTDVGSNKAVCAAAAGRHINPSLNVVSHEEQLGGDCRDCASENRSAEEVEE